jgi:hypothetical protein
MIEKKYCIPGTVSTEKKVKCGKKNTNCFKNAIRWDVVRRVGNKPSKGALYEKRNAIVGSGILFDTDLGMSLG